jgi:hypothetical protein
LIFKVIEIRVCGEAFYRHDELPFMRPGPHFVGRKSVRTNELLRCRWTSVLSADRMRPVRCGHISTGTQMPGVCSDWLTHDEAVVNDEL